MSIATGLVSSSSVSAEEIMFHIVISVVFFAAAMVLMPGLIRYINGLRLNLVPKNYEAGFMIFLLMLFVVLAGLSGINLVFGAFLAGIAADFIKNPKF